MRKGQAALEFLTTYGWAILIILVMIGAISYFGIMRPSSFLPERCITTSEFNCEDFQIKGDTASFQLKQGLGKTIIYQGAGCTFEAGGNTYLGAATAKVRGMTVINPNDAWSPRDPVQFDCRFNPNPFDGAQGSKVKVLYNITYRKSSGSTMTHTTDGEIYAEVQ